MSPSIVPSGNFAELNRTVTCMVLKANDRRTSCPCHDEFCRPRSDYVRQNQNALTVHRFIPPIPNFVLNGKLKRKFKPLKQIHISYFEAQKLIAPQFSQTYAQVANRSIAISTTQTDENITKVKFPPLQILKPLLSVPHPNASPSIISNSTSSSTTQANLLPSASSIKPTTQTESRLPEPISSAAAPDNSLNPSASSLSTETRPFTTSNKFAALSTEIQSLVPQVHLLPSTSTVATVSEPQPPNPTSNDTPSITNTTSPANSSIQPPSASTIIPTSSSQSVIQPPSDSNTVQNAKKLAKARSRKRKKRTTEKNERSNNRH
ncbi:uncharacterized protein TNCV_1966771 [Trichonephila clavipes]|nr:uncharacterized protein TNCV_1966771 [Trichonephila clavipes]